ncbi:MAG: N-acetyl-gamma-glutamyl-phosphate reductase [Actinomycetota bacterium]|nr:N-acetyl-gamma-glutamyl-phosphate reductase [Actinomycetota bacterium]
MVSDRYSVGVVGARGYAGAELLSLLASHRNLDVTYAGSRELEGQPVPQVDGLTFGSLDAAGAAALGLDAIFLALPDGVSKPFVAELAESTVIVDISADHRFDDQWVYGLPELFREKIAGARRIANPGCYATAMQLTVGPFVNDLGGVPAVFGVSGYSGAGTTPSPKNDPERLADNLIPYKLVGHNHEREATRHLGHEIRFMPHVHPAFRGLLVTSHIPMAQPITADEAMKKLSDAFDDEQLIDLQTDIPELRDGANRPGVLIGGVTTSLDGRNLVVVAAEDNLLKGAAAQAVQNLNLALGLPEFTAIL